MPRPGRLAALARVGGSGEGWTSEAGCRTWSTLPPIRFLIGLSKFLSAPVGWSASVTDAVQARSAPFFFLFSVSPGLWSRHSYSGAFSAVLPVSFSLAGPLVPAFLFRRVQRRSFRSLRSSRASCPGIPIQALSAPFFPFFAVSPGFLSRHSYSGAFSAVLFVSCGLAGLLVPAFLLRRVQRRSCCFMEFQARLAPFCSSISCWPGFLSRHSLSGASSASLFVDLSLPGPSVPASCPGASSASLFVDLLLAGPSVPACCPGASSVFLVVSISGFCRLPSDFRSRS